MYRKTYLPALPTSNYFKLSNAIFRHSLTPIQLAVYSYLVCCAGQDEKCWPSISTIADACNCSPNAARAATNVLHERKFISKRENFMEWRGKSRQSNNVYFLLALPHPPLRPKPTYREGA